jgi:hypothetical protein
MKLSAIAISALITFSAVAQNPKQQEKPKTKTSTSKKVEKAKRDSIKISTKNKTKTRPISPDYCPPCGMG